jgi:hypothetical protein
MEGMWKDVCMVHSIHKVPGIYMHVVKKKIPMINVPMEELFISRMKTKCSKI